MLKHMEKLYSYFDYNTNIQIFLFFLLSNTSFMKNVAQNDWHP